LIVLVAASTLALNAWLFWRGRKQLTFERGLFVLLLWVAVGVVLFEAVVGAGIGVDGNMGPWGPRYYHVSQLGLLLSMMLAVTYAWENLSVAARDVLVLAVVVLVVSVNCTNRRWFQTSESFGRAIRAFLKSVSERQEKGDVVQEQEMVMPRGGGEWDLHFKIRPKRE
jgi:uncharacterized membrane protein